MDKAPRYHQLALALRKAIEGGEYEIGDQLPTEHKLCEEHKVSRHTARAALQMLEEDGLIDRRRGAGTRIVSKGAPPSFVQPLGGLDELLQYARNAAFKINKTARLAKPDETLSRAGAAKGPWLMLEGVRYTDKTPLSAASVYVKDAFGDDPADYDALPYAITELLRKRHGVTVSSITQTITADLLTAEDAASLDAKAQSPILKTTRRYFDDRGALFVVSVNRHPAHLFSYEMTYKRGDKQ